VKVNNVIHIYNIMYTVQCRYVYKYIYIYIYLFISKYKLQRSYFAKSYNLPSNGKIIIYSTSRHSTYIKVWHSLYYARFIIVFQNTTIIVGIHSKYVLLSERISVNNNIITSDVYISIPIIHLYAIIYRILNTKCL